MIHEYRYEISVECRYDNSIVVIDTEHIKSLILDYDYDNNNMPIVLLSLIVDKNINDTLINNKDKAKIYLVVYKYVYNSDYKVKDVYIEEEFTYFMKDDNNKKSSLDYRKGDNNKDLLYPVLLGLVDNRLVEMNKQNIMNTIFTNSRVIDMICRFSSNRKLLIEPPNDKVIDQLVIVPKTSYTDYIQYLDKEVNIYENSYYRLFYDFDRTYIMSGGGTPVYAVGENKYPIIMYIVDSSTIDSKTQGMDIDNDRYIIIVDELSVENQKNNSPSFMYNNIISVDSSGNKTSTNINSDREEILQKTMIVRDYNKNNSNSLKSSIENKEKVINIVKNNLDCSIFTINKEFIINNQKDESYTGHYLLNRKVDIFSKEADHFAVTNLLTFSQIKK